MNVQRYARVAAVLLLVSMIAGGFGEGYMPSKIIVSGDSAATVANVTNFNFLYRLGFAAFLIESLCDIALVMIFYALLRPVNRNLSALAAFFGLVGTAVFAVGELFYLAPTLLVSNPASMTSFSTDQINGLVQLSFRFASLVGMGTTAYYGMSWLVRAHLIFRSGYLPKFLGVVMGVAGLGFVVRNFLLILAPAYASLVLLMLMLPAGLLLMGWLFIKGVNVHKWNERVEATA
jgi:Domain of unknown function (DUF4386)